MSEGEKMNINVSKKSWLAVAVVAALCASVAEQASAQEALAKWGMIASEPDGSMTLYYEQGSYEKIMDRGTLSLRMVTKLAGGGASEIYQQLIFPVELCAKGAGLVDRYTLDGQGYSGSVEASRTQANGRLKNGAKPGYSDMAAETMCQAYESQEPKLEKGSLAAEASKGDGEKSKVDGATTDASPKKPSLAQRIKAVFQ